MQFLTKLANTISRIYWATPSAFRWMLWVVPLLYFIFPFDLDRLGLVGRVDDIALIIFAFWALERAGKFSGFFQEAKAEGKKRSQTEGDAEEPQFSNRTPYEILELMPGASRGEIKKAYRRLLGMYHPDKFAHLGAEFERTAQRRTQEIIAAYERLCK